MNGDHVNPETERIRVIATDQEFEARLHEAGFNYWPLDRDDQPTVEAQFVRNDFGLTINILFYLLRYNYPAVMCIFRTTFPDRVDESIIQGPHYISRVTESFSITSYEARRDYVQEAPPHTLLIEGPMIPVDTLTARGQDMTLRQENDPSNPGRPAAAADDPVPPAEASGVDYVVEAEINTVFQTMSEN